MRLRTALVTARSAPAHERAIRTLMDWNISVDEAMFLGGLDKGAFLREFEPDFYFDDQTRHVDSASRHVPAGHVQHGIANEGVPCKSQRVHAVCVTCHLVGRFLHVLPIHAPLTRQAAGPFQLNF